MAEARRGLLRDAKRIVVKVGSSLVTNEGRGVDAQAIGNWCRQLAGLAAQGREVVMVSSGAIAEGMKRLGWTTRPHELPELQAAAAVGQMGLAQMYETQLSRHGLRSAQVLLTHADLADRERYLNARSTLLTLLKLKVIPVVNENDTVVNDEIKFGDNDTLAALVANLIEADALVILTDQRGLFTGDPRQDASARFIDVAAAGDPELERMAGGTGSSIGRGGMITKVSGRQAGGRKRRKYRHCLGSRGRRACCDWQVARRSEARYGRPRQSSPHASSGWPTTCNYVARSRSMPERCRSCVTKARACCRSV